jgi:hypothetical protein
MLEGVFREVHAILAIGSTALIGKFRGQLATTTAVDANNLIFLVAYGIIEGDFIENSTWFMKRLHGVIGHPLGLVIHTDACKGLQMVFDISFLGLIIENARITSLLTS